MPICKRDDLLEHVGHRLGRCAVPGVHVRLAGVRQHPDERVVMIGRDDLVLVAGQQQHRHSQASDLGADVDAGVELDVTVGAGSEA